MSVITSYSTRIRLEVERGQRIQDTPGWSVLVDAVEAVAEAHGGQRSNSITDCFGRMTICGLALVTPEFPRGIGVSVGKSGEISFQFDDYGGYEEIARALSDEISQNFAALAVSRALESLNYSIEMEEDVNEEGLREVLVRGDM